MVCAKFIAIGWHSLPRPLQIYFVAVEKVGCKIKSGM